MIFRDGGGGGEIRRRRAAMVDQAREVIAGFLTAAPGIELPPAQLQPTAQILSGGLAAMVVWWQDHPEVEQQTLVAAAGRLVSGLAD
ncbi:MAG: hypothetical protein ACR2NA_12935 [Solirubrobacterales bacterium]